MTRKSASIGPYFSFLKLQLIPKHNLSYLEYGDSTNPEVVICLHGLTRNAADFDHLAIELSKNFRVISVDLPGRGCSDWLKNKKHYNYYTYIKDIVLLLKKLNINSVHWVGSSMGGIMGMAMATYYKKYIKTLIINDVGPELPRSTINRISKAVSRYPVFETIAEGKEYAKRAFRNFGITREEDWDHITENSTRLCSDNKYRLSYDVNVIEGTSAKEKSSGGNEMVDLWYLWRKIECPVMLIHGTKSDILLPETIEKMKKKRGFFLHQIENAGHTPALVYKEDISVIHNWLNEFLS